VDEVFADLDSDDDGRLSGPELLNGLSDLLGEALDPMKVSAVITTFDQNEDHRIDLDEWKALIEQHGEEE
jgi:Ca2+-binding EF-hand superfamily protein